MQTRLTPYLDWLGRLALRMAFVMLLAMAATVSGLLLYDQLQPPAEKRLAGGPGSRETREPVSPRVFEAPKAPLVSGALPERPPEPVSLPQDKRPPAEPATPVPKKPVQDPGPQPAVDPQKRHSFRRAISLARSATRKRDFAGAKQHLKTAEADVQDQQDQSEFGRLDALVGNLEEFWKGMRTVVGRLVPAQEIMLGETPILVVEVDADRLTVRSEGRNHTYRIYDLPRPIVEALAQRGFAQNPSAKILLGTYMAMDPNGDRQRARQLWEQAARQGEDVGDLMDEIKGEE